MASDLATGRQRCADFLPRWHAFARRWNRVDESDPVRARRLVVQVLEEGLPAATNSRTAPRSSVLVRCETAVIDASGTFDAEGYAAANRLATRNADPLRDFVDRGWRDLRAPSLRFDLWWYWCSYLDPTSEEVDPLLHHLLVGRHEGLEPVPGPPPDHPPTTYGGTTPRRACLYAAYDRDGIVDETVVAYVRELARHADVFYLADGVLADGELDKLDGVVAGAWSLPHAAYDFGSWSLLARDLVGWARLDDYDEVVLANDSCFLLRPLDEVFATMDARACDWWSLQATSMEFNEDDVGEGASMPLAAARREFVGPRRWSETDYLHLSSYFQVLRRPVLDDPGFRHRLDAVCGQRSKQLVVDKYEVGISRYLMDAGFAFDTWVDDLLAFHPLYSTRAFDLIGAGFPLVKRNFLAENPRHVPAFRDWPERLLVVAPEAPVVLIRSAINRVSPDDRIRRGLDVGLDPHTGRRTFPKAPRGAYSFRWMDEAEPKFAHWWAFPVGADDRLDAGARAVFEAVRHDPTIRKLVLTRSRAFPLEGENIVVLPIETREAQKQLARCREVLVDRTPRSAVDLPLPKGPHHFVHLGTGLPIGPGDLEALPRGSAAAKRLATDYRRLNAMVVASGADALAKAAATPLQLHQLWLTGLPRHDLVTRAYDALPTDLRRAEQDLRDRLGDRRLVVLWPRAGRPVRAFRDAEVDWLADWCRRHDAVLGVRESVVDRVGSLTQVLGRAGAWELSARRVPDASVVLRVADAVITDDADDAVDFLLTGRPLLHLEPPRPDRAGSVPGFYPPEAFLPGPVCATFDALTEVLETVFDDRGAVAVAAHCRAAALVSDFGDDLSAWRLVERLRRQHVE